MSKLLKMGLVVPLLVLALAFTGVAVQAADQAQNDKDLNQDLNQDLNPGDRVRSSGEDRIIDNSDDRVTRTVTADDGVSARRGSLDRRGRGATKTDVSLGSDRDKWWQNSYHNNDDEGGDGGDEGGDDEDEGYDEDGGETPSYP